MTLDREDFLRPSASRLVSELPCRDRLEEMACCIVDVGGAFCAARAASYCDVDLACGRDVVTLEVTVDAVVGITAG